METIFKKAADPFETLSQLMDAHEQAHPGCRISAVENGVYVSEGGGHYHLGISSGDGATPLVIDAGMNDQWAMAMARHVCSLNPELKKVSMSNSPYIAVVPKRIADVQSRGESMIFKITGSDSVFHVRYGDSHRADIESFLIGNKIISGRMGQALPTPAPLSTDEKNKMLRRCGVLTPI